ncbi:autotransporter outer membrane beta-barrel domain-containing protein, partial [Alcaligenaceae bacterium 429]
RYARVDRNALALQAGVTLNASEHMSFTASAGTRVLGDSRAEVNGQLSINWKF